MYSFGLLSVYNYFYLIKKNQKHNCLHEQTNSFFVFAREPRYFCLVKKWKSMIRILYTVACQTQPKKVDIKWKRMNIWYFIKYSAPLWIFELNSTHVVRILSIQVQKDQNTDSTQGRVWNFIFSHKGDKLKFW